MSTRGCVAIKTKEGWEGVYNHSDSYPTCLGQEVFEYLKGKGVDGLKKFAEDLLKYDDWRNYLAGGKCEYCGQSGFGQPHSISGVLFIKPEGMPRNDQDREIEKNINETGFPDPMAKWHMHGDLGAHLTHDDSDPLFIEWVYVIDAENQKMLIYTHGRAKGTHKEGPRRDGQKWESPNYTHYFVCELDINPDAKEPNWEAIEGKGNDISNEMHEKYGKEVEHARK